ncbi:hypothetical protein [Streptomyces sp. NA03103]|uniref:hypothetical protein n=1 Tax=unclassified Streptomyces TaxID=2593676 RepID=UPI0020CAB780|nr:hypothetical protein [Streptomyces sp. NA03103]
MPGDGRSRLSYRRAGEIFEENTRLLANPPASSDDIEDLDGWTQHRLRHSALTHDAEDGRFGVQLLGQPTGYPLGDGDFLQLVAHLLKLLAQLLCLRLQLGPAGRDQLTKARSCVSGHLTHLPPGSYGRAPAHAGETEDP